jgi:hypothetical protein
LAARWRIPWSIWTFVNTEWRRLSEPPTTRWEEATVFAAARPEVDFDAFVRAVLTEYPPLAARCLLETGRRVSAALRQAVIDRLLAIVGRRDSLLKPIEQSSARLSLRIAAGHALGKLGDPRILAGQGRMVITDLPSSLRENHPSSVMREGRNLKRRWRYTRKADSDKLRPSTQWCVRARLRDWFCAGVMC